MKHPSSHPPSPNLRRGLPGQRGAALGSARRPLLGAAAVAALAQLGSAQLGNQRITISIDWKSRSVSHLSTPPQQQPMTEADLLVPAPDALRVPPSPASPPVVRVRGGLLGLAGYPACVGHPPGTDCDIELDALSGGDDDELLHAAGAGGLPAQRFWFSVDEWAAGHPGTPTSPPHATVRNQGNPGTPAPVFEACADVFVDVGLPPGPLGPTAGIPPDNVGALDGDGVPSSNGFVYPGLGLIEPNNTQSPNPPPPPYTGDNLDALEIGTPLSPGSTVYFSLDSGFPDPLNQVLNSGSAAANGFRGGDVLKVVAAPGTTIQLYAAAQQLGLDRNGPTGSDDLDALILRDNGDGAYQPSLAPYDWSTGATDMLIFSVRRNSAVIGKIDSIFGVPIEAGDLLVPPIDGVGNPGIFIAAERLGLRTSRTHGVPEGDDVDAADVTDESYFDCNENGQEDSVDIATGYSADANGNGIPDECDDGAVEFCTCGSDSPCSNTDPNAGCDNSTGQGARLVSNAGAGGSVSVAADDLILKTTQVPPNASGMFFMSANDRSPLPFEDGLRCLGNPTFRYAVQNSGTAATFTRGPGTCALSLARFGLAGAIDPYETWYFQTWYRDPTGPCGQGSNLSNAIKVMFQP